jgi:hypothetical protein
MSLLVPHTGQRSSSPNEAVDTGARIRYGDESSMGSGGGTLSAKWTLRRGLGVATAATVESMSCWTWTSCCSVSDVGDVRNDSSSSYSWRVKEPRTNESMCRPYCKQKSADQLFVTCRVGQLAGRPHVYGHCAYHVVLSTGNCMRYTETEARMDCLHDRDIRDQMFQAL